MEKLEGVIDKFLGGIEASGKKTVERLEGVIGKVVGRIKDSEEKTVEKVVGMVLGGIKEFEEKKAERLKRVVEFVLGEIKDSEERTKKRLDLMAKDFAEETELMSARFERIAKRIEQHQEPKKRSRDLRVAPVEQEGKKRRIDKERDTSDCHGQRGSYQKMSEQEAQYSYPSSTFV